MDKKALTKFQAVLDKFLAVRNEFQAVLDKLKSMRNKFQETRIEFPAIE